MADVRQEELFGSILPNVFIRRITLDTTGDSIAERNPHIDHEREPDVVRNPETGKLERVVLTPDYLKKSAESKLLNITLDLIVKEKLDGGLISTWFENTEIMKYLSVKIIQSTSVDATSFLSFQQTSLDKDIERISDKAIQKFIRERVINLDKELKGKVIDDFRSYDDEDGSRIYDITLTQRFVLKNSDPDHLAYFAVAYIDVERLAKDYELDLPPNLDRTFEGRVESDLVIDDGEAVSESFVFLKENGKIWTGEIHQLEDRTFMTGKAGSADSEPVKLLSVPNNKIQDFRNKDEIERLQIDFSIFENDILHSQRKLLTNDNLDVARKTNYFTDLLVSMDSQGDVRFFAGLDFLQLARDATLFGSLYRDSTADLLQNVKIRSLALKRVRVADNKNALLNKEGYAPFDENDEPPAIIIFSGEKDTADNELEFKTRSTGVGSIRELEIYLESRAPGTRFFTGMDKSLSDITFGLYKYGLEIEIEDNTTKYISDLVDNLLDSRVILQEYLNEASNLDNFNVATNRFTERFIKRQETRYKRPSQKSKSPWNLAVMTYIDVMSVFNDEIRSNPKYFDTFISFVHPRTGNVNSVNVFIQQIESLATRLAAVISSQISGKVTKWQPGQDQAIKTSTLSLGAIPTKTFKVGKYFSNTIDSDLPRNTGFDFLSSGELDLENNNDGLKVVSEVEYKKRTEKETLKYYKNMTPDVNLRSKTLSYTKDDEINTTRYSFLTPSSMNLGGKESSAVFVDKGQKLFEDEKYKKLNSIAQKYITFAKRSPYTPATKPVINNNSNLSSDEQIIKDSYTSIFSERGMTVEFLQDSDETVGTEVNAYVGTGSSFNTEDVAIKEFSEKKRGTEDKGRDINPNNFFVELGENLFDLGPNAEMIGTRRQEENKDKKETIQAFNLQRSDNLLDAIFNSKTNLMEEQEIKERNDEETEEDEAVVSSTKQEAIKQLPNQIKSLFLASTSPEQVNKNWFAAGNPIDPIKDPNQKLTFKINYNFINQVDVLVGFERGTDENNSTQIKTPIWKKLNVERFNKVINKNLLCRMTPYANRALGIEVPKGLDLPIYNKYFILSPEKEILPVLPKPKPTPRQYISEKTFTRGTRIIAADDDRETARKLLMERSGEFKVLYPPEYTKSLTIIAPPASTVKQPLTRVERASEDLIEERQTSTKEGIQILKPDGSGKSIALSVSKTKSNSFLTSTGRRETIFKDFF